MVTAPLLHALHGPETDPAWRSTPGRLLLLVHLGRDAPRDDSGRGLLCGMGTVAAVRGLGRNYRDGDVQVQRFLGALLEELSDGSLAEVVPYRPPYEGGRATAVRLALPPALEAAFVWDCQHRPRARRLYHAVTRESQEQHEVRKMFQREAEEAAREREAHVVSAAVGIGGVPQETLQLVRYLNGADASYYDKRVREAVPALMAGLADVSRPELFDDPAFRARTTALRDLLKVPRQHYAPALRTQRLVPVGSGLATEPKASRRRVLHDCFEVDWRAAQLALVASVWDVPEALRWLDRPGSVWDDLLRWVLDRLPGHVYGPEDFDRVKGAFKRLVYGLCFGQTRKNLLRFGNPRDMRPGERAEWRLDVAYLRGVFGVDRAEEVGGALLQHPALRAIHQKRAGRMGEIERCGRLEDVFGRVYVVGSEMAGKEVTVRHCLAAEMQAAEHFVMLRLARVFLDHEAARSAGEFARREVALKLWQSDGLSFWVRKKEPRAGRRWFRALEEALRDGCADLEAERGCPPVRAELKMDYAPAWFATGP